MNCKRHKISMYSYEKENIRGFEKEIIREHIKECKECKNELWEIKAIKEIFSQSLQKVQPPNDIKSNILSSINLNKYNYGKRMKSFASIGTSMVVAGILLMILNYSGCTNNYLIINNSLAQGYKGFKTVIVQPIKLINKGFEDMSEGITQLDGITLRMKNQRNGGNVK